MFSDGIECVDVRTRQQHRPNRLLFFDQANTGRWLSQQRRRTTRQE